MVSEIRERSSTPAGWRAVAVIVIVAVVVAARAWFAVSPAIGGPTARDFVLAESQRKVLDVSLESYSPLLVAFSSDYTFARDEELSA